MSRSLKFATCSLIVLVMALLLTSACGGGVTTPTPTPTPTPAMDWLEAGDLLHEYIEAAGFHEPWPRAWVDYLNSVRGYACIEEPYFSCDYAVLMPDGGWLIKEHILPEDVDPSLVDICQDLSVDPTGKIVYLFEWWVRADGSIYAANGNAVRLVAELQSGGS